MKKALLFAAVLSVSLISNAMVSTDLNSNSADENYLTVNCESLTVICKGDHVIVKSDGQIRTVKYVTANKVVLAENRSFYQTTLDLNDVEKIIPRSENLQNDSVVVVKSDGKVRVVEYVSANKIVLAENRSFYRTTLNLNDVEKVVSKSKGLKAGDSVLVKSDGQIRTVKYVTANKVVLEENRSFYQTTLRINDVEKTADCTN